MIKLNKIFKESNISSEYASLWKDALAFALEKLESEEIGESNNQEEMYFFLQDINGKSISYQGFASFNRIYEGSLFLDVVYPYSVSVVPYAKEILSSPEEPEINIESISSIKEKNNALDKIENYISSLENDLKLLNDWTFTDEDIEITDEMINYEKMEELEIELPDNEWLDLNKFDNKDEASFDAMTNEIINGLLNYYYDVSHDADHVINDAKNEIKNLINSISLKINNAYEKLKEIKNYDDYQ